MFDFDVNLSNFAENSSQNTMLASDEQCPNCKISLSEILREGVVGCPNCYEIFSKQIKNYILNSQNSVSHIGKIPQKLVSKIKAKEQIAELEIKKNEAVKNEDYITAEAIKKQIENLKEGVL